MKRFFALLTALCLLMAPACAESLQTEEGSACGVTIWRNHQETRTELQEIVLDYPTFTCDDAAFEQFLTESVTEPIQQMAAVEEGIVRGGYYASLDFEGVLSLEASVHRLPEGAAETDVELFYAIIDLKASVFSSWISCLPSRPPLWMKPSATRFMSRRFRWSCCWTALRTAALCPCRIPTT